MTTTSTTTTTSFPRIFHQAMRNLKETVLTREIETVFLRSRNCRQFQINGYKSAIPTISFENLLHILIHLGEDAHLIIWTF